MLASKSFRRSFSKTPQPASPASWLGSNAAQNNVFTESVAIAGCAIGAPAAGVGCCRGGGLSAPLRCAIHIVIAAGVVVAADMVVNKVED